MFPFDGSPVPVRTDLKSAYRETWKHLSRPGPTLDASQRIDLLRAARSPEDTVTNNRAATTPIESLSITLYQHPPSVNGAMVAASIAASGEAATVEAVSIVSMLAAVDGTHRALGIDLERLPEPEPGEPTRRVASGMKRRRSHVPMPRNSITVALELLPDENEVYASMCGPQYMTFREMTEPRFGRTPGLDRAQLETIASRTSLLNECFY